MNYDSPLFAALLAMDSYNRGYHQGVAGLERETGTQLGEASLIKDNNSDTAKAASFYATAWRVGGQDYIAYRGTDQPNPLVDPRDLLEGWSIGLGFSAGTQADLAQKFYEEVLAARTCPHPPTSTSPITPSAAGSPNTSRR